MGNIAGFIQAVPIDWFILGGILVLVGLDTLRCGIGRACALAVALPLALFLHSLIDSAAFLGGVGFFASSTGSVGVFAALLIASYILVRRMGLDYIDGGMGQPVQALLAGAAVTAIFAVVWLQLPLFDSLWHFDTQVSAIFAEQFRLFWLLGAYAALAFARG